MPAKPSIYPEMLAPNMNRNLSGKFSHSLRLIRDLRAVGVEAVDLFAAFGAERENDVQAGDSLYQRTDTHFRGRAVRLAASVVADRIKKYPWYVPGTAEFAIDTVIIPRRGDIGEMTKLAEISVERFKVFFEPESVKCYQVYRNSQVLVIGDSYSRIFQTDAPRSAGWISHLAVELSQPVASIVNDGGASTLVRETLARKIEVLKGKKVVVWEIVERDIRYGEKGWKNVKLAAAE
jgi:hypothetical protein